MILIPPSRRPSRYENTYPCTAMKPRISLIVAMAKNRTIGVNNSLPWRCPEDLKHFKSLTMGHHMIMGRKTYESIGKPLPGRITVVVSRNLELKIAGCIIAHSLEQAIAACLEDDEIFIVGGAEVYAQAMALVDQLYITEIQEHVEGDAHFPKFTLNEWQEESRLKCSQLEPLLLEYHFVTYHRGPMKTETF
jgi:dihydrofolate reductase